MVIKIEINELVLHGFNYHDYKRIGNAIEHELSKLIAKRGLPKGFAINNEIPKQDAGSFSIKNQNPRAVGFEVAKSVFNAWKVYKTQK